MGIIFPGTFVFELSVEGRTKYVLKLGVWENV